MTPHILTRKTRLRPRNFLINDAKGLLQQYRPVASLAVVQQFGRQRVRTGHGADYANRSFVTRRRTLQASNYCIAKGSPDFGADLNVRMP